MEHAKETWDEEKAQCNIFADVVFVFYLIF